MNMNERTFYTNVYNAKGEAVVVAYATIGLNVRSARLRAYYENGLVNADYATFLTVAAAKAGIVNHGKREN